MSDLELLLIVLPFAVGFAVVVAMPRWLRRALEASLRAMVEREAQGYRVARPFPLGGPQDRPDEVIRRLRIWAVPAAAICLALVVIQIGAMVVE